MLNSWHSSNQRACGKQLETDYRQTETKYRDCVDECFQLNSGFCSRLAVLGGTRMSYLSGKWQLSP